MLTAEKLWEELEYRDGKLWWRKAKQGRQLSVPAGSLNSEGYRRVNLNGKDYQVHRLVWLYHYGEFPEGQLDHIDRNAANNRIDNLRLATNRQNNLNKLQTIRRELPHNVYRHGNGFRVDVQLNGRRHKSPSMQTVEEAVAWREANCKL